MAEDIGNELADGKLGVMLLIVGELDEDEVSLAVFGPGSLPFRQDRTGKRLGMAVKTQENMVLALAAGCHPGVADEPGTVPEAARHDEEHHAQGESDDEHEDGEVGHHEAGLVEDDRGNDVVEHHGMADEHLEGSHQGNHHELDPVAFCNRMGRVGQKDDVHGGSGHKEQPEDGDDGPAVPLPVQVDERQDKACRGGQKKDGPCNH